MKNVFMAGVFAAALAAAPAFAQSAGGAGGPQAPNAGTAGPGNVGGSAAGGQTGSAGTGTSRGAGTTTTKSQAGTTTTTGAVADQSFVKKAAAGGMAEVELGRLAKDKASSEQVKQFGQRMVDDHTKANDELKTIAQSKNITLPTELNSKDKSLRDKLSKLSGERFDREYMQAMVKDHREDVNEFRKESTSGRDPELKAFAAKTLPTLEEHLSLAQRDAGAVATSGRSGKHTATDKNDTTGKSTTGSSTTNPNGKR